MDDIKESEFMDIQEACIFLDCHPVTLTRKAKKSKIPAYKKLNKWLFRKADLAKLFVPNEAALKK
jgi:hypothetical protein